MLRSVIAQEHALHDPGPGYDDNSNPPMSTGDIVCSPQTLHETLLRVSGPQSPSVCQAVSD